jgi:hypothetical protein
MSDSRPKEVGHDESPSIISSHPFQPKGEWWSLCGYRKADGKLCNLSESAHTETIYNHHEAGNIS